MMQKVRFTSFYMVGGGPCGAGVWWGWTGSGGAGGRGNQSSYRGVAFFRCKGKVGDLL